ncbi:MAG: 3,5-cyclic adenosine monophosphate phosphodiesterase CpdA [Pseudomonadota bacterium]|jgi:hypothetical protein
MAKRRWRLFGSARLWWILLVLLLTIAAVQGWQQVPRLTLSHEIFGRMNDENEVRLIFVGDTGTGDSHQLSVAAQMEDLCQSVQPAGVVLLGDNFYPVGVDSVTDPLWESHFEKVYSGDCLQRLPFYAVLGNHDYRSVPEAQIAYTRERGGRWNLPARYYSLRFGSLLEIAAADTNIPDRCGFPALCSVDWLIEKMKASTAAWKVLIGHHPILSGGKYRSLKALASFTLPELYCQSGVSAYISGHDHGMQHLAGKHPGAACQIEQFVSGAGGGELYPIDKIAQRTLFAESSHGVLLARFTRDEQRYEFHKVGQSEPVYMWSMKKGR